MFALFVKFQQLSFYERSAVFPQIPNIPRITVRFRSPHITVGHVCKQIL